ncbi:Active breakpoint cluster region-related protein [Orchesella cincta]|uniref:Active breakpoint cluster region-related protein n=1 Tax=Orchesella cincta TaxID=48709 RepID=A0A1D2NJ72_ORCCI|nr:Active breakpoint cluster region-related protein [Orchesella cincta]
MVQPEQLHHGQDRSPRHLVKNSFIVELSEGHRKLRHLFLFNDVLVCAKYKASGRNEKFTFELKWYIPVMDCMVVEECSEPRESAPINLVALRSQASTVRDQIKRQTSRDDPKKSKAEKQRKKLAELEAQLVLASPNLVFKVKSGNGRAYTFFLSSEYERCQWVDAIEINKVSHLNNMVVFEFLFAIYFAIYYTLLASQSASGAQLSMHELQSWLTSCRKDLKTNMGSYLLRTGRDENLLVGDFYVLIGQLKGILRAAGESNAFKFSILIVKNVSDLTLCINFSDLYICVEVDSYGHFFRKAKTKMICESTTPNWNQDFVIELEGAQNLRILLYEDHPRRGTLIRAKNTIELNRSWLTATTSERKIELHDYVLTVQTRFIPSEMTIRRVPTAKPSGLFGAKITQVCKREKRQIPFILTSCVREAERRGINEVGIYRVSGSASDVSRLKKAFETNSYEAEQLLKEVDIHSVTGTLKLYLRELPEALFTDDLYPRFFEAFNLQDQELRKTTLLQLFSTLPPLNQHIVVFLLDHMVRVNSHENHNKMSLHNMATVFGPTLLRPGAKNEGASNLDLLAAGTVDVMAQAGILYFFLTRRCNNEPLQPSQMN